MPNDTKKERTKKNKNEPKQKEQSKHKNARGPVNLSAEKISAKENVSEKLKIEEPGPEFYKDFERETDDTLKIIDGNNSKYSKKVIESNWKKYETPIESYEEREEYENTGADFEFLVNAPLSGGGHFQFKHEKSWDTAPESNQFDKYFDINMANLTLSLSTIPFYERNDLDIKLFSQSEIVSMEHKANKHKKMYQPTEANQRFIDPCDALEAKLKECLVANKAEIKSENKNLDLNIGDEDFIEEITGNLSTETEKLRGYPGKPPDDDEEDLEGWLDDFLSKE